MTDVKPCETCENYVPEDKTCSRPLKLMFSGLVAYGLAAASLRGPRLWKCDAGVLDDECGPEGRFWKEKQ